MPLKGLTQVRARAHTFAEACLQLTGRRLGNSIHVKVAERRKKKRGGKKDTAGCFFFYISEDVSSSVILSGSRHSSKCRILE